MSDMLDVVIPYSIAPWQHNLDVINRVLDSVWSMLGQRINPYIICDYPSDFYSEVEKEDYRSHIRQLKYSNLGFVFLQHDFRGQVGSLLSFFRNFNTKPVVYYHHDDWEILNPKRVDAERLVNLLADETKNVEMVKFHKRTIVEKDKKRRVDHIKVPTREYGVPLVKTSGWGTSPHFASIKHYEDRVLPFLQENQDPHGRRGIENGVYRNYREDQLKLGFEEAHNKWGVYIYGKFGDEAYINHLGNKRIARRRKNDEEFGVNYGSGFTFTA